MPGSAFSDPSPDLPQKGDVYYCPVNDGVRTFEDAFEEASGYASDNAQKYGVAKLLDLDLNSKIDVSKYSILAQDRQQYLSNEQRRFLDVRKGVVLALRKNISNEFEVKDAEKHDEGNKRVVTRNRGLRLEHIISAQFISENNIELDEFRNFLKNSK